MTMANFAKNQLLKYGWMEGKGLGKNENGIVEAIKPKLKLDTTGVGHSAQQYNWWEDVYNKASANLNVDSTSSEVQLTVKDKHAVEIATSKSELTLKALKREDCLHYGNFVKTSTLQDGKTVRDKNYLANFLERSEEAQVVGPLTDEELFKACKGRTAHKGARHGLRLSGKLARIERCEQEYLAKQTWTKEKKKRKHDEIDVQTDDDDTLMIDLNPVVVTSTVPLTPPTDFIATDVEYKMRKPKSRKSRVREKRKLDRLTHKLMTSLDLSDRPDETQEKKEHKKSKKSKEPIVEEPKKKRRKKSKHSEEDGNNNDTNDDTSHSRNNRVVNLLADVPVAADAGGDDDGFVSGDSLTEIPTKRTKQPSGIDSRIRKHKKKKRLKKEGKNLEKLSETLESLDLSSTTQEVKKKLKSKNKC